MMLRLAAWTALAGMALNVLEPLVHTAPKESATPVCTSGGIRMVPAGGFPAQPPQKHLVQHCEMCVGSGHAAGLSADFALLLPAPSSERRLVSPRSEIRAVFHFSPAAPRGPPVSLA